MAPEEEKLKLGKSAAFVQGRLKRLRPEDETCGHKQRGKGGRIQHQAPRRTPGVRSPAWPRSVPDAAPSASLGKTVRRPLPRFRTWSQ